MHSVTPVREALVSLRGEGFVVLQPRRGFMVAARAPKLAQFLVTATRYSPRLFFAQIAGWARASADDHLAAQGLWTTR